MSQANLPTSYVPMERKDFERNVGGINFGRTENSLDQIELADANNLELDPEGGFRLRLMTQLWMTNYRYVDLMIDDHTGQDSMGLLIHWPTPGGSRRLLAVNTADGLVYPNGWGFGWTPVPFGSIYLHEPVEEEEES